MRAAMGQAQGGVWEEWLGEGGRLGEVLMFERHLERGGCGGVGMRVVGVMTARAETRRRAARHRRVQEEAATRLVYERIEAEERQQLEEKGQRREEERQQIARRWREERARVGRKTKMG